MSYSPEKHHRHSIRLKGYDYSKAGLYFITICCQDRICRFGNIKNDEMELNEFGQIAHNEWEKLNQRFPNLELDVFQIMPNHLHGIIALNNPPVGAGFTPAPNTGQPPNNPGQQQTNIGQQQTNIGQQQTNIGQPQTNIGQQQTNIGQPQTNTGQPQTNTGQPQTNIGQQQTNIGQQQTNIGQPQGVAPTVSDIVGAYKSLVANGCLKICKSKNEMMGKIWQRNYYEHIIRNKQSYKNISEYIINNPAKWNNDKFYGE